MKTTISLPSRARVMVEMSQSCHPSLAAANSLAAELDLSISARLSLSSRSQTPLSAILTPGRLRPLLVADSALTQSTVSSYRGRVRVDHNPADTE